MPNVCRARPASRDRRRDGDREARSAARAARRESAAIPTPRDALLDHLAIVLPGRALDQLGEHPVRGGRVILVARAGLPVELPRAHPAHARRAVVPIGRPHRRVREAGRVEHHLLDRDRAFVVRGELGEIRTDPLFEADLALGEERPHRARDERLRRREDAVAVVGARGAERLRGDDLALECECDLAGRQEAVVDLATRALEELRDLCAIDAGHQPSLTMPSISRP